MLPLCTELQYCWALMKNLTGRSACLMTRWRIATVSLGKSKLVGLWVFLLGSGPVSAASLSFS